MEPQSMIRLLLIGFLCLVSPIIFANNTQYQIELLVYTHMTTATLSLEQWSVIPAVENPITDNATTPTFTSIDPEKFILKKEVAALAKQPEYQVIYHAAWQTSAYALANTQTLYITNGTSDLSGAELNGNFKISLDRYFNTRLQLYLNEPTSLLKKLSNNTVFDKAGDTFHFSLNQSRRMRSDELNLIAQPVFGVLMKIIPIKTNKNS